MKGAGSEMKETLTKGKKGRREWVKNAIIIFLAVLLVLTFFSNTIMNYSLPEVAAQYPASTTITTKIRGSGTVAAAQSYNVTVQETRTVASVDVKKGDTIAAGQTLLTLDASESQELQDARSTYNDLKLEYDKLQVAAADQSAASSASLSQLKTAQSQAETDLASAKTYEQNLKSYQNQEASAKSTLASRTQEREAASAKVESLTASATEEAVKNSNASYLDAANRVQSLLDAGAGMEDSSRYSEYLSAVAERDRIYQAEIAPELASRTQQLQSAQQTLANATTAESQASAAYTAAQDATAKYQSDNSDVMSVSAAEAALQAAKDAVTNAEAAATDAAAQQAYDDAVAELDMAAKEEALKQAEEKVKTLEEKSAASKIVSRYAGVVTEVNIAAGDTTTADEPLMVVELTEKGYTLTATVTKAQAQTLREGLEAEITNLWNSNITMKLTSIANDKTDPSGSKQLTFSVTGDDVTVGESLSFSVGDKNASYDVVIPSSAIHTDADGSFVYTVQVKSSPLGNRYTVKKKTVTVLAADDTSSAVSGELSTADFVITTSTVPLEVGDQVRIAE
jgi:multidrug efflux pump subunit AcrA (membrane-fusion protein)